MSKIVLPVFLFLTTFLQAQTNVRAWYANGQVWMIWNVQLPLAETVGIYASPDPFTHTDDAILIGRPYHLDYLPTALKEQVDTAATYRIPDGQGGIYSLASNEGLFVFTPHQEGSLYFAVTAWGDTSITSGMNITDEAVSFGLDPVECHPQAVFPSPFAPGFICFAYYMWVDGRQNHWEGRPDFPIMANAAKNGMPGFFMISVPADLDTSQLFPLSVWLHGGGGKARQSLAGSRAEVNIRPVAGILLAHNDDVFGRRGDTPAFIENPSRHFGWRKNWDPFTSDNFPTEVDTVINYTQRRYLWIDTWLMRHFNVDPHRIHIHGHSMGASGTTALAKAFPDHYASAVIFNNGFRGHAEEGNTAALFGPADQSFPTNLRNRNGEVVRMGDLTDLSSHISAYRDLPVIKSFHGKNDTGNANHWGVEVVDEYQWADASGHGMALYWSEREHGIDTGPDFMDHWVSGVPPDEQTATDNVAWGEEHYRSDISYPAFFNHRLDPNAHDPGDGTIGTGPNGVGDDWGTWGGWHRWDAGSIQDEIDTWSVEAWLEANAIFENDNCPQEQLVADMSIRRAVNFNPETGHMISWKTEDAMTGAVLQNGTAAVGDDDLVILPGIILYPENTRRVKITVTTQAVATEDLSQNPTLLVYPNPVRDQVTICFQAGGAGTGRVRILSIDGKRILEHAMQIHEGINDVALPLPETVTEGLYMAEIQMENVMGLAKLIIQ